MKPWMYIWNMAWATLVLATTTYVVFGLGQSGWWFALGICIAIGMSYTTEKK